MEAVDSVARALAIKAAANFKEVYRDMEALDEKIEGVSYSAATETVVIPTSIGSYADETIILK